MVEIQLADFLEKGYSDSDPASYRADVMTLFHEQLQELIGGMLCVQHVHVPEISPPSRFRQRGSVQIGCCCRHQVLAVKERVAALMK